MKRGVASAALLDQIFHHKYYDTNVFYSSNMALYCVHWQLAPRNHTWRTARGTRTNLRSNETHGLSWGRQNVILLIFLSFFPIIQVLITQCGFPNSKSAPRVKCEILYRPMKSVPLLYSSRANMTKMIISFLSIRARPLPRTERYLLSDWPETDGDICSSESNLNVVKFAVSKRLIEVLWKESPV